MNIKDVQRGIMNGSTDGRSAFFALVFRQKYIQRWGLMRNISPESLSEHAAECAVLTHALATIANKKFGKSYDVGRAVSLALFHDVPEVFTGDMPTPIKYASSKMRAQFEEIEKQSVEGLIDKLPAEFRDEYRALILGDGTEDEELKRLVKSADRLCAYIKCIEEEKVGNREFTRARLGIEKRLCDDGSPELKYFIENFLPAFRLTLDEQQD